MERSARHVELTLLGFDHEERPLIGGTEVPIRVLPELREPSRMRAPEHAATEEPGQGSDLGVAEQIVGGDAQHRG